MTETTKTTKTPLPSYYSRYVVEEVVDGRPLPETREICHFGESNTHFGLRIGSVVCLSRDEAERQIAIWNLRYPGCPVMRRYSLWSPEIEENGTTPFLPGLSLELGL